MHKLHSQSSSDQCGYSTEDINSSNILRTNTEPSLSNFSNLLCADCNKVFESNTIYQRHVKNKRCLLYEYGCNGEINCCSPNQHFKDENHLSCLKSLLNKLIQISIDAENTQYLTELLVPIIQKIYDQESQSIDDKLILDIIAHKIKTEEISSIGDPQITDEHKLNTLNDQMLCIENERRHMTVQLEQFTQECQTQNADKPNDGTPQEIGSLKILINTLQHELKSVPHSKDGLLIWKIPDVSSKINKSGFNVCFGIDSPYFLTLTGEHRVNARVFLYGDELAERRFVSLHVYLNLHGNDDAKLPLTCVLVDQTNENKHIVKKSDVCLTRDGVGRIYSSSQFIETSILHKAENRFVKDDTIFIIIKFHEDLSNKYKHYPTSVQNALEQLNEA